MNIYVPGAGNVTALNTLRFIEAAETLRWRAERRCGGGDGYLAGVGAVIANDRRRGCHLSVVLRFIYLLVIVINIFFLT